jgi:hypothetical protein
VLSLPNGSPRPPGSIEPDALRLVVGLVVIGLFVGFAVLMSASVVALTTYLAAVLGSLSMLSLVLFWPASEHAQRRKRSKR